LRCRRNGKPARSGDQPCGSRDWWQQFGDAELDALIKQVLERNNDLAAAAIKVRQAMLQADLADTDLAPTPSFSLSSTASQRVGGAAVSSQSHSASLSVSYELDLWGKLAHQRDAKAWEARATVQDMASSRLSLIGSTIKLYWKQAWLRQRLVLGQASIDYQQQALRLVLAKQQAGAAAELDVLTVRQSLASQQASLHDYQQQLAETQNALAILLDGPPKGDIALRASLPATDLPDVPAGLPVALLAVGPICAPPNCACAKHWQLAMPPVPRTIRFFPDRQPGQQQ
jgi:outer membrane protein TolC